VLVANLLHVDVDEHAALPRRAGGSAGAGRARRAGAVGVDRVELAEEARQLDRDVDRAADARPAVGLAVDLRGRSAATRPRVGTTLPPAPGYSPVVAASASTAESTASPRRSDREAQRLGRAAPHWRRRMGPGAKSLAAMNRRAPSPGVGPRPNRTTRPPEPGRPSGDPLSMRVTAQQRQARSRTGVRYSRMVGVDAARVVEHRAGRRRPGTAAALSCSSRIPQALSVAVEPARRDGQTFSEPRAPGRTGRRPISRVSCLEVRHSNANGEPTKTQRHEDQPRRRIV
jgi:hypothetical protein